MRKLFSGLVLALLLASVLVAASNVQPVKSIPVWTVPIYILADGSISPSGVPIQQNGIIYTLNGSITSITDGIIVQKSNIAIDGAGYTLQGNGGGNGFNLTSINNVTIKNTRITHYGYGVWLDFSSNNTVSGNDIANNWYGISLWGSSNNNTVSDNKITSSVYGIYPNGLSSNNTVSGNTISNSTYGFYGFNSLNNIVSRNNLTANDVYGIYLGGYSSNNNVSINNITATSRYGIYLGGVSNNTVSGNTMANNGYEGIFLDSSSNNAIYHNYFINNTVQAYSLHSTNVWDDGSKGNYWSDYLTKYPNASEIDSSGVWNTSYIVDANNTDHYPLMNQPIIPEFPSFLMLPLMMIATLLAVTIYKKKITHSERSVA